LENAVNQSFVVNSVGARRPIQAISSVVAVLLIGLFVAGCAKMPQSIEEIGPRYKPANIYKIAEILPAELRRVAVLPLTTPTDKPLLISGVQTLETTVYSELEKSERFEVIPVSGDQLREWTGHASWSADEPLPPNLLQKLREGTGCDAILFCQLIRYQPYEPLAVGWKFSLVDKGGAPRDSKDPATRILWSADEVFDAGDVEVATAARVYYSQHLRNETPLADSSTILGSPSRFGQYTLSALFSTLPKRSLR
jgi:hypothetical protein